MAATGLSSRIECATSSRIACKKCQRYILKGQLRVEREYNPDCKLYYSYHVNCFSWYPTNTSPSEYFLGWDKLKPTEQCLINKKCKMELLW